MPAINTVSIISKPRSEPAARVVPKLIAWLEERGIATRLDRESASYAGNGEGFPRNQAADGSQLMVVLGGDGTLLSGARAVLGKDIPLFAVNLGGLGFLTSIKVEDLYPQLERVLEGQGELTRRGMLHTELWRGDLRIASYDALNDMVLSKSDIARMIDLEVHVYGNFMCVYKADGLIVATPTGSTAYSLAAGGPIVFPTVAGFLITPICPHTLTNTPVVVPDECVIEVIVRSEASSTYLTIDGQVGEILKPGDRVVCQNSRHSVSLVRPPGLLFFDVLREKLKWGGR